MKKHINTDSKLIPIIFISILVLICELIVKVCAIPNYILPAPSATIKALFNNGELLLMHTKTTLFEAIVGFFLAIVFSLLISVAMNRYKIIKSMIYPILIISQTVPIIAIAPLFIIWFGWGQLPKILIVILVCFFPIAVNVTEGLDNVDNDLIDMMKVMKASPTQIFTKVQLPAVLPAFFSGIKIAATYSIMGAVIAEWTGGQSGLGIYMIRVMRSYMTDALFADILIIVTISIGFFQTVNLIGKKMMPWKK